MEQPLHAILDQGIIAIVRGVAPSHIIPTVEALYSGGIGAVEITFDQRSPQTIAQTLESLSLIHSNFQGRMLLGAGTVLTVEQVESAAANGAQYMISPNVDVEVIRHTKKLGCLSFPGALTPTEIVTAHNAGADAVKLFPAGTFGPGYIKAIMGPLGHIPYFAVGGITPDNMEDFIEIGVRGFGIGGNLVDLKAIMENRFEAIEATARRYSTNWTMIKTNRAGIQR